MTNEQLDQFLDRYSIDQGRYSIGPFFSGGVTLYKQQVRALNMVYALGERHLIHNGMKPVGGQGPDPRTIGVIGGGVAGMTAAVAAATLGNEVWHFEQRPDLCHLQAGCETRWIHPHNYDWPDPGSDNPYAGLHLMNWQAGTAAEVARTLTRQYLAKQGEPGVKLRLHLGATTFLSRNTIKWDNCVTAKVDRAGSKQCDLVILAMGFGIERFVRLGEVPSYWRNDDLNQLRPGVTSEKREVFFVSGTGDGGLVDMLRSKISEFNQAWIIEDLFTDNEEALLRLLQNLRRRNLFDELRSLFDEQARCRNGDMSEAARALQAVLERLRPKIRKDVSVILNGRGQTFADSLHPRGASVLNCFLAFLLHVEGEFTYVQGDLGGFDGRSVTLTSPSPPDDGGDTEPARYGRDRVIVSKYSVDRVIVRHGTEREEGLGLLGLTRNAVATLKQSQKDSEDKSYIPQWEAGWWSQQKTDLEQLTQGRKEFLPPASEALSATFVQTLGEMVFLESRRAVRDAEFRLTVHRAVEIQGNRYFQQMSPYAARGGRESGQSGRIYALEIGIVGLVFRIGLPIVLVRGRSQAAGTATDQHEWANVWAKLKTDQSKFVRTKPEDVGTLAAIPVFNRTSDASGPHSRHVSLVIFADSKDPSLFVPQETQPTSPALTEIFRAARGFVRSCEYLIRNRVVRLSKGSFLGVEAAGNEEARQQVEAYGPEACDASMWIEDYGNGVESQYRLHWDCNYVSNQLLRGADDLDVAGAPTAAGRPESPA